MNMRNKDPAWLGCVTLAILATGISLCLSVFTGWQLGDSFITKAMMAAVCVLAVMAAHLMPAIYASKSQRVRFVGLALWLFCMAYVAFSHANFFLSSQQQTGMQREMAIVSSPVIGKPQKDLIEVLNDKVKVQTELARIQFLCRDACTRLTPTKANLEARLAVLDEQESVARNWQKTLAQQQKRQDIAHDNPVLGRLAEWSNVTVTQLELFMGMIFSLILEGVACFCWYLVLQPRDSPLTHLVTTTVIAPVAMTMDVTNTSQTSQVQSSQQYDDQVEELAQLVKCGRIKLTVASIREYCRCAQGKAAELKRLVQARIDTECHV